MIKTAKDAITASNSRAEDSGVGIKTRRIIYYTSNTKLFYLLILYTMTRLSKPIDLSQTLAKSTQTKLRKFYRIQNPSLPVRIRQSHLIEALGVSDSDAAYAAIAELYNENVRTTNEEITTQRTAKQTETKIARNKQARDRRAAKKNPPVCGIGVSCRI